jgi:opacity protein-like surface antigen
MIKKFFLLAAALLLAPLAFAQVAPSTTGGNGSIVIGVQASAFKPDSIPGYTGGHVIGPGFFFDINLMPRWGAEGEARWLRWKGSGGQTQSHYLIGPRYRVLHWHRLAGWAKLMMGAGVETFPNKIGTGSYFDMAPGGDLDYRFSPRIDLRLGYEYQYWPAAPNIPNLPNNGMHPSGFSIGIGYRIIRQK